MGGGLYPKTGLIVVGVCILLCIFCYVLYRILRNPFRFPYFERRFDVSGKRNVHLEDLIDKLLCDDDCWGEIVRAKAAADAWKVDSKRRAENSGILSKRRMKQYQKTLDEDSAYRFISTRSQTRYRQRNYVKTSYKVNVDDTEFSCSWAWLKERRAKLEEINLECPLREYHTKNQRKLMTKKLKEEIMIRDNFTCQNCGKYMPDRVGLHIDHIVPVSRGGKSVPSNLQVLCSVCNGSKGSKQG